MSTLSIIALGLVFGFLIYWLVMQLRRNPESLNKNNLLASAHTIAVVTLLLIAVIAFCVMMLR